MSLGPSGLVGTLRPTRRRGQCHLSTRFGGHPRLVHDGSTVAIAGSASRGAAAQPAADHNALIAEAAKDLSDYQRLTAEGKLGEAGQKLEELKRTLDKLNTR